ncbi:carboxypeptidase-like regulatory domain-containing protein [Paraburkholderia sp. BL21I4N1]|uniref:carboxypeptidase-like regulatory domain-containing protein n=1 Tax=Paraburkholderia sp. BL21I4N1 TaxID=1938801 RepID=UPI002157C831|nr:carboxypeptidase-like regulatory domain-containing protein [Paraburkholderia sp. BL21I4N1]
MAVLAVCGSQFVLAASSGLPPTHKEGAISYLSGGIGSDQSSAIKSVMNAYPLVLEFVGSTNAGNDYLADVPVQISDSHGNDLLNTQSDGPFMLVSLPHGRYNLTATYNGKTEHRRVNVTDTTHAHAIFMWPM